MTERDFTADERQAFYDDAARAAAYATAQIRRYLAVNPYVGSDAAWAASDTLHVAANALGNPHLRRAADAYDRAARAPYGRIPKPTPAGNKLRTAARLLAMAGLIGDDTTVNVLVLVANLIALTETIAQLREIHQRDAQAAAARSAREHLEHATPTATSPTPGLRTPDHGPTPVDVALANFPVPWAPIANGLPDSGSIRRPTAPSRHSEQPREEGLSP